MGSDPSTQRPGGGANDEVRSLLTLVFELWTRAGPYRVWIWSTILGFTGLVGSVAGFVAWFVSFYATQAQLANMECSIKVQLLSKLEPVYQRIATRASQVPQTLVDLDALDNSQSMSSHKAKYLFEKIKALEEEGRADDSNILRELTELSKQCSNAAAKPIAKDAKL